MRLPPESTVCEAAPELDETEVEPYSVEEVQRLLLEAAKVRNTARWVIALALGLRQCEVLGLQWEDVDFEVGVILVRRGRLRPRYKHGCGDRCGRKPCYCPTKINIWRETKSTKSKAGKRPIGVPQELMKLLAQDKEMQDRERLRARDLWVEKGYVLTSEVGEPLNLNTDYHRWKDLLKAAEVRYYAAFRPGGEQVDLSLPEQWAVAAWDFEVDLYTDRPVPWRTARRPGPEHFVEAQVRGTDKSAVAAAFVEAREQAADRAQNPGRYGDSSDW
ncbi:hypothetical protein KNE206_44360 [Kitasatospora sp. NE20-6]